jgi:hypothetical protein
MLDNLRDDAASSFYEEDTLPPEEVKVAPPRRRSNGKLLGMTSVQRFIIATMLMIAMCTLGTMCLLLTNKIGLIF